MRRSRLRTVRLLSAALVAAGLASGAAAAPEEDAVRRGEYVLYAGGCLSCHTDSKGGGTPLAGGRPLETPFGVFYGPNLTADPAEGIGRWTEDDFVRAMRQGISPDGDPYYPAFPYTSFTGIADPDLRDLWAYLKTVPQKANADRDHKLGFPFGLRSLVWFWRILYFDPGVLEPVPALNAQENRGRYLGLALGHCGECHTPRNLLGARREDLRFAGTAEGPDGDPVPNITPDPETGIGGWSVGDITFLLEIGMLPDGDFVGGAMSEVVDDSTSHLIPGDREAIALYLKSLSPVRNAVSRESRDE